MFKDSRKKVNLSTTSTLTKQQLVAISHKLRTDRIELERKEKAMLVIGRCLMWYFVKKRTANEILSRFGRVDGYHIDRVDGYHTKSPGNDQDLLTLELRYFAILLLGKAPIHEILGHVNRISFEKQFKQGNSKRLSFLIKRINYIKTSYNVRIPLSISTLLQFMNALCTCISFIDTQSLICLFSFLLNNFVLKLIKQTIISNTSNETNVISNTNNNLQLSSNKIFNKPSNHTDRTDQMEAYLLLLKMTEFSFSTNINIDSCYFIKTFLTLPSLFTKIQVLPLIWKNYQLNFPLNQLIIKVANDVVVYGETVLETLTILANIIDFTDSVMIMDKLDSHPIVPELGTESGIYLIRVINRYLSLIPTESTENDKNNDSNDTDSDTEDPHSVPSLFIQYKHLDSLTSLCNPDHLDILMRAGTTDLQETCALLVTLMSRFPTERLRISSAILYNSTGQGFLELLALNLHQSGGIERLINDPLQALADVLFMPNLYVIVVLVELYTRLLLTLTDTEFFKSPPIPLSLIQSLTAALKSATFSMIWNFSGAKVGLLSRLYLVELLTRLLGLIHARDSRRPFVLFPKGWWVWCPTEVSLCMAEIHTFEDDGDISNTLNGGGGGDGSGSGGNMRRSRLEAGRELLRRIPFLIPFSERVSIFRNFLLSNSGGPRRGRGGGDEWVGASFNVQVQRGRELEDGFEQLNHLGSRLREKIQVGFIDNHGLLEAGIDGGGVFKEFLTGALEVAFKETTGLFVSTEMELVYPAIGSKATSASSLKMYEFMGRIIGKAMWEGILVDVPFAPFFLTKWLNKKSHLDDLSSLDATLYQGLLYLKSLESESEVNDLYLTFSLTLPDHGVIELVPGGASMAVTKENRLQYIYLMANYKLNIQISRQCRAFFRGLSDLIDARWLQMFSEHELMVLIGGEQAPIDVAQLEKHVVYGGVYDEGHATIKLFWKAVAGFTESDRALLLKFITSCARPPLLGFQELVPKICIRFSGQDQDRLPTASTCVNLLKLPAYTDIDVLTSKLLYAIRSGSGFELS